MSTQNTQMTKKLSLYHRYVISGLLSRSHDDINWPKNIFMGIKWFVCIYVTKNIKFLRISDVYPEVDKIIGKAFKSKKYKPTIKDDLYSIIQRDLYHQKIHETSNYL